MNTLKDTNINGDHETRDEFTEIIYFLKKKGTQLDLFLVLSL